jgi:RHH-type proline utilization regulon transcriptional repressor/proline dehydrogenase/delta 1-pyrroline-5-carboxylate dehydrogenase
VSAASAQRGGPEGRESRAQSRSLPLLPALPDGRVIRDAWLADERSTLSVLAAEASVEPALADAVAAQARAWVEGVRARQHAHPGIDSFLQQYDLSTEEGVLLMCVAEALLRIPDARTADALIRDKLSRGDWERHLGGSDSLLVNASTWGLLLTGRLTRLPQTQAGDPKAWYGRMVARAGEPVVRLAVRHAMKLMAEQFVMGRTIEEALARGREGEQSRCRYSFDMLGEAALTAADAERYGAAYAQAIAAIGAHRPDPASDIAAQPSISVKLSALHPRYEYPQRERVLAELVPVAADLAVAARDAGIGLTVDAEEAERLELSLEIFSRVRRDARLAGYAGLGLAVQAYQKRARAVVSWVTTLARECGVRIPVRLVKGAYWDTEVKRAHVQRQRGYPEFTRKAHTDVSVLACARALLDAAPHVYPMVASHNAHTIAWVAAQAHERALDLTAFEFQRLHGMGEALYAQVIAPASQLACRVYAPVGSHEDLLPYLVRRLLENGANTSFVNRIGDARVPVDDLVADPVARARAHDFAPAPNLPLPRDLYGPERRNSAGVSLADQHAMAALDSALDAAREPAWVATPMLPAANITGTARTLLDPADARRTIGTAVDADERTVDRALGALAEGQPAWDAAGGEARSRVLDAAAAAIEGERDAFVALLAREAGKTRAAALAEVREAADFCRYYGVLARRHFAAPLALPSPTGEANTLALRGRGVFACISPWNFPLAIFTGQVAAALAAGNAVAAKPAEQTPLTAAHAVRCLLRAGVPPDALALLPGAGETVGAALAADARVAGVAFTGSTAVASGIARVLAARTPIVPLIAETGGQNAMIVDSSALPEQVVQDALVSAFDSAGQRCSALRVLCLQDEIAPRVLDLVQGAMDELVVGDPAQLATDVGPVIDAAARDAVERHIAAMAAAGLLRHRVDLPAACDHGTFVAPALVVLDRVDRLEAEVFGPVLHVLRYRAAKLDALVDAINGYGYGLTLGVHSRIDATVARIVARARVGNLYVNRNMIGAVVGTQPFGGEGLSGTGPKAGGPHYLFRFAVERTLSVNTAAAGGNATLLAQAELE